MTRYGFNGLVEFWHVELPSPTRFHWYSSNSWRDVMWAGLRSLKKGPVLLLKPTQVCLDLTHAWRSTQSAGDFSGDYTKLLDIRILVFSSITQRLLKTPPKWRALISPTSWRKESWKRGAIISSSSGRGRRAFSPRTAWTSTPITRRRTGAKSSSCSPLRRWTVWSALGSSSTSRLWLQTIRRLTLGARARRTAGMPWSQWLWLTFRTEKPFRTLKHARNRRTLLWDSKRDARLELREMWPIQHTHGEKEIMCIYVFVFKIKVPQLGYAIKEPFLVNFSIKNLHSKEQFVEWDVKVAS